MPSSPNSDLTSTLDSLSLNNEGKTPGKGLSKSKIARMQKKAVALGSNSSSGPSLSSTPTSTPPTPTRTPTPVITATSQQSRFHKETLSTNPETSTTTTKNDNSNEVDIKCVNLTIQNREILVDAHLRLKSGVRYGMVGQNGVGKSLLMHVLGNRILSGLPENVKFLYIKQLEDIEDGKRTVLEEVLSADEERERIIFEAKLLQSSTLTPTQTIQQILISRSHKTLIKAQKLAEVRSGQRGYEARQRLLQVEAEHQRLTSSNDEGEELKYDEEMIKNLIDEVLVKFGLMDVDKDVHRARMILKGLGFEDDEIDGGVTTTSGEKEGVTLKKLSGGWRMRVGLAKALFVKPDVLLLDEPTNHLDLPAILWLQNYLTKKTQGQTVLIVSHDRKFLDEVTEETVIFKDKKLKYHNGNYEDWERNTEEQRRRKMRLKELEMKRKEKIEASIQKNVAQAKSTGDDKRLGMVASRKKKLERMGMEKLEDGKKFKMSKHGYYREEITIEEGFKTAPIHLPPPEPCNFSGSSLLQMDEVTFRYKGGTRNVINKVTLNVGPGARIGLLGPNGCGKSTLMNLMAGELTPIRGEVKKDHRLRIGYFSQHTVDQLELGLTPLEHLKKRYASVKMTEGEARAHFGSCGVSGEAVTRAIGTLSGGERNRVALGLITFLRPHVLLLDEITNHLDMGTVESVVESLCAFEGGLVVVSHDVWFLSHVAEELYAVGRDGGLSEWTGGLSGHIATLYLWDRASTAYVPSTWDQPELWHPRMVFVTLRDAFDLERTLMSVSTRWGVALESHYFWQQAITLLDPTDSLTPLPSLSPYRHFRHILSCSCLVCRINLPATTRGLMLAKRTLSSYLFGPIPLCREHDHKPLSFCGLCFRQSFHHNHNNNHSSITTNTISENEDQDTFPGVEATCRTCRTEFLIKKASHHQILPAIGGLNLLPEDWETRQSVDGFIELGEGSIADVITIAKEKWWLRRWTRLGDMLQQALAAHRFNNSLLSSSKPLPQRVQEQLDKDDHQADEEEDEDEEDEEEDEDEEDTELMQLEEGGVKDLALGDWARTRILDGFWISPADLWYNHTVPGKPIDTPSIHPCPWTSFPPQHHSPPPHRQSQSQSQYQLDPHPSKEIIKAEIPPSFTLCEQAFIAHGQQLRSILLPPMKNIVRRIAIESALNSSKRCFYFDDEDHDGDEEEEEQDPTLIISKLSLEDVVRMLREEEGVWFDGYDWIDRRRNEVLTSKALRRRTTLHREEEEEEGEEEVSSPATSTSSGRGTTGTATNTNTTTTTNSGGSNDTSPVLSTTTLQTTPSPPPPPPIDDSPKLDTKKSMMMIGSKAISFPINDDDDNDEEDMKQHFYTTIMSKLLIPVEPIMSPPKILRSIPFIPIGIDHLPQYSYEAVKNVWREACSPLYHCRCRICERAVAAVNNSSGSTTTTTTTTSAVVVQEDRKKNYPGQQIRQEPPHLQQQQRQIPMTIQLDQVSEIEYVGEGEVESGSEGVYGYEEEEEEGYEEFMEESASESDFLCDEVEERNFPTTTMTTRKTDTVVMQTISGGGRTRKRSIDEIVDEEEEEYHHLGQNEFGRSRTLSTKRLRKSQSPSRVSISILPSSSPSRSTNNDDDDDDDDVTKGNVTLAVPTSRKRGSEELDDEEEEEEEEREEEEEEESDDEDVVEDSEGDEEKRFGTISKPIKAKVKTKRRAEQTKKKKKRQRIGVA